MAITTIQAPARNLLSMTMSAITPVVSAPTPLMTMPRPQPASRRRHQRTTMLDCDRVKARKTPSV